MRYFRSWHHKFKSLPRSEGLASGSVENLLSNMCYEVIENHILCQ